MLYHRLEGVGQREELKREICFHKNVKWGLPRGDYFWDSMSLMNMAEETQYGILLQACSRPCCPQTFRPFDTSHKERVLGLLHGTPLEGTFKPLCWGGKLLADQHPVL